MNFTRKGRPRGRAIVAAVATLVVLAPVASGALLGGLGGTPAPAPSSPTTSTSGTLTGFATNSIGLGTVGSAATCPATTTMASLAEEMEGLDEAAAAAKFAACALHVLDFEWRTYHSGAPNPIVDNRVVTTLGVPTPLNLDGDVLPEAAGTALVLAPNKFQLRFDRTDLGLQGALPAAAELIINDPSGGTLPSPRVGVGLDARSGRFPLSLALTFTLESFRYPLDYSGPPRFRVDITSARQAERAAITADLFDEKARTGSVSTHVGIDTPVTHVGLTATGQQVTFERDSSTRVEVGMRPLPSQLTAKVATRADHGVDADLLTTSPTTVDASAVLRAKPADDGSRRIQRVRAEAVNLPAQTTLNYRPIAPFEPPPDPTRAEIDQARGGQTFRYTSTTPLSGLNVTYDDVTARPNVTTEEPALRAKLNVRDLPTDMVVSQLGSFTDFSTLGGQIGRIEGAFALNGELVDRRTDRPGLRYLQPKVPAGTPKPLALAARIDGVREVHLDTLDGRTVVDVGIAKQPFDVDLRDEVQGLTATASVEDLPANAHIEFLPAQKGTGEDGATGEPEPLRVRYDAGDHAIGLIKFNAAFDKTMGDFLDQIEGKIVDLPPVIDVSADLEGKVYSFESTKPFGSIEALARNAKAVTGAVDPELTAGSTGVSAVIRDNGPFAVKGRVMGLKSVIADVGLNKYHVEAGAVPLEVRALVDEVRGTGAAREVLPRELLGTIENLPSKIDVSFDQEAGGEKVLTYEGEEEIDKVALQLTGPKLYADEPKINKLRAGIFEAPKKFTARLGSAGKLDLDAGPGVGKMEALVTSGPDPDLPATSHAAYVENGERIAIKAQLLGFKRFVLDPDPMDVTFETAQSLPLNIDSNLDLDENGTAEATAKLDIKNVPAKIEVGLAESGAFTYDASSVVDEIDLRTTGLPGLPEDPGKIDAVDVDIDEVPRHIEAGYGDDGRVRFKATDENGTLAAVGGVEIRAATKLAPALPSGLSDSNIAYRQVGSRAAARVRVDDLREIDVTPAPLDAAVDTGVLAALDIDAAQDATGNGSFEKKLKGALRSNIRRVTAKELTAGAAKRYEIDTGFELGSVTLDAEADDLPMGVKKARVVLEGLPEMIRVDVGGGTSDAIDVDLLRRDAGGNLVKDGRGLDRLGLSVNDGAAPNQVVKDDGTTLAADGLHANMESGAIKTAALVLSGLRGVTFATTPHTKVGIDVAQDQARPLALDLGLDGKTATGYLDKLPENLLVQLSPRQDTPITYEADQRIQEIKVQTDIGASFGLPFAEVRLTDAPREFEVCFRTDSTRASCMTNLERFRTRGDRKFSAAYISDTAAGETPTKVYARVCFQAGCTGEVANVDVTVPRRLQVEAGASFETPNLNIPFDCYELLNPNPLEGFGVPAAIDCTVGFAGTALNRIVNGTRAKAWLRFDTGGSVLTGNASFSKPLSSPFDKPLLASLSLPTITATDAFVDVDAAITNILGAIETGGSASCNGGSLNLGTGIFIATPNIPLPEAPQVFKDGAAELGFTIPEYINVPDIDEDIDIPVLSNICP